MKMEAEMIKIALNGILSNMYCVLKKFKFTRTQWTERNNHFEGKNK
jgi:hypothetical protein